MRTEGSDSRSPSVPGGGARLAAGAAWLLAMLLVVAVSAAVMGTVARLAGGLGLRPALMLAELALAAPGLLLMLGLRRFVPLQLASPGSRALLLAGASGAALWATSLGLFELQYVVWKPPPGYLEAFRNLHQLLRPSGPLDALLSVGAIALAPALCEEILFRGLVLPSLRRPLGAAAAVFASAVLFGMIHLDPSGASVSLYRVPFAMAVGIALGTLRLRAGSLWAPIVAHAVLNTITFLVAPFADDPAGGLPDAKPLLGAALLFGGGAASVLLLRLFRGRAAA